VDLEAIYDEELKEATIPYLNMTIKGHLVNIDANMFFLGWIRETSWGNQDNGIWSCIYRKV
jgi:hypothetical protein